MPILCGLSVMSDYDIILVGIDSFLSWFFVPYTTKGRLNEQFISPTPMLETIAIILLILWLLGVVTAHTLGGFIYILLVVAVVMILLRLIRGRRV